MQARVDDLLRTLDYIQVIVPGFTPEGYIEKYFHDIGRCLEATERFPGRVACFTTTRAKRLTALAKGAMQQLKLVPEEEEGARSKRSSRRRGHRCRGPSMATVIKEKLAAKIAAGLCEKMKDAGPGSNTAADYSAETDLY
uniref:Helicase C-terminal domain-containing protein n=1 Tax=Steinernema glaseri TaxID=37863 RepID=A0A1I8AIM0_9BILA